MMEEKIERSREINGIERGHKEAKTSKTFLSSDEPM